MPLLKLALQYKQAVLRKHVNPKTGKSEYALVSPSSGRVLQYFGGNKPSKKTFDTAERRVEYFKHKNAMEKEAISGGYFLRALRNRANRWADVYKKWYPSAMGFSEEQLNSTAPLLSTYNHIYNNPGQSKMLPKEELLRMLRREKGLSFPLNPNIKKK